MDEKPVDAVEQPGQELPTLYITWDERTHGATPHWQGIKDLNFLLGLLEMAADKIRFEIAMRRTESLQARSQQAAHEQHLRQQILRQQKRPPVV